MSIAGEQFPFGQSSGTFLGAESADAAVTEPSPQEQDALLSFFQEPPVPQPMRPGVSKRYSPSHEDPLCMTALQTWASTNHGLDGIDELERTWRERRRFRRTERIMLNAALYVAATLIVGAFAFVQLEDSIASNRDAADRVWQTSLAERRAQIEYEEREALATARKALTQSDWTGFITFVKDSRQHLPKIRDHYREWSYAPFHDPKLQVIEREESPGGLSRVRIGIDQNKKWSSAILLEKVNGNFKVNWDSFRERFKQDASKTEKPPSFQLELEDQAPNAMPYFSQPTL